VATLEEASRKIAAAKAGTEGTPVADTPSSEVYGWLLEAGGSSDFEEGERGFSAKQRQSSMGWPVPHPLC
jgi:hypothetical protein